MTAGQSKRTRTLPAAAPGMQQLASVKSFRALMREQDGVFRLVVLSVYKDSMPKIQSGARHCKELQRAERHANSLAGAAEADHRECSCPGAKREAEWSAQEITPALALQLVLPNTSLNLRANGMPPGSRHRAGVHCL